MSQLVFKRSFRQINVTYGGFTKRAYAEYAKEHGMKRATAASEAARMSSYEASQKRLAGRAKAGKTARGTAKAGAGAGAGAGGKICRTMRSGKVACFVPKGAAKGKGKGKTKGKR